MAILGLFWGTALGLNFGNFGLFFLARLWASILAFLGLFLGKALGFDFGHFGPFAQNPPKIAKMAKKIQILPKGQICLQNPLKI